MKSLWRSWLCLAGIAILAVPTAFAWTDHYLVTAASLQTVPELRDVKVTYNSFHNLLSKLGLASELEFNQAIKIHKSYRFEAKIQESVGKAVSILDVLSTYSDEPDWGMDQNLFATDQYPELWDPSLSMMGGKETGTPTQAFRHMYWPEFSWTSPLATFKLPFSHIGKPMGDAPERSRVFLELARKARAQGEDYWSARFTANAIHYLQDVGQPYHSTQVPTKRFAIMPFTKSEGQGFKKYVTQMTRIVSYYHFALEDYLATLMGEPEGKRLWDDLAKTDDAFPDLEFSAKRENDMARQVRAMALFSNQFASQVASACIDFFPPMTEPFVEIQPKEFLHSPAVWDATLARGRFESPAKTTYFDVVKKTFAGVGVGTRSVVREELIPAGSGLKKSH